MVTLMIEETDRVPDERLRLVASAVNVETDRPCTLVVVQELNKRWTIHGLGAKGVRLSSDDMITLAGKVLDSQ